MANKPITTGLCATGVPCCDYDCREHGTCESIETVYNKGFRHVVANDYSITVGGNTIHLNKTDRICTANWNITRDPPVKTNAYMSLGSYLTPMRCFEHEPDVFQCSFSDVGTMIYSTVFYIDHRYGVCLYRRETEKLSCSVSSNETAQFKQAYFSPKYSQIQIKTGDYTASRKTEWVLIKDGFETILASETFSKDPFGAKNTGKSWREMGWVSNEASGVQYFPDYRPDPNTRMILIFPQPPSLGIPISPEICRLGFYDYSNEPGEEPALGKADGGKDMFYPQWYRDYFYSDPMWAEARDRRWNSKWWHMPEEPERNWSPPALRVDPLPIGTYAKHPQVGEVYQWLMTIDGSENPPLVSTSINLNTKIDNALLHDQKTHDTTLYFPIGVA